MKILGQTKNGFIVEVYNDEMANIRGYGWYGSDGYKKPEVGQEKVEVSEIWRQLETLRESKKKLSGLAKQLRAYADLIEYKEPEVNKEVGNIENEEE